MDHEPPADLEHIAMLAELLGAARLNHLLDLLGSRLEYIAMSVVDLPARQEELVSLIHQSRGSAGSLGFSSLMPGLLQLESEVAAVAGLGHHILVGGNLVTLAQRTVDKFSDARRVADSTIVRALSDQMHRS